MRTAVIGSRGFENYNLLKKELEKFEISLIISGGAKGADTLAEKYAKEKGIETIVFNPEYELYGKKATFVRNDKIINECERLIAFWDNKSKGTESTYKKALKKGKDVHLINYGQKSLFDDL